MLSHRTAWDFHPNDFSEALAAARAEGRPLIDLTESNPTRIGLDLPEEQIVRAFADPAMLRYEPTAFGMASAREAVAEALRSTRGTPVALSRLVLTASSSEAYSFLLKLLCDPGDAILVPQPSYPLFDELSRLECVRMLPYALRYDGRWQLDVQSVRNAMDPRARALFVVSPNNPTGSYLRRGELAALEEIAREHDLAIVSDEVFEDYVWEDHADRVPCVAAASSVLSFSLGGLSKAACLPQMKLGWILAGGPEAQVQEAMARLEMIADTFLSVGTPVQRAAALLLETAPATRARLCNRIRANLQSVARMIVPPSPISAWKVEAGWYAVLRVPRVMTDEQWAVSLVREANVIVHPGSFFGFESEGFIVLSLIPAEEIFSEGLGRIVQHIANACG